MALTIFIVDDHPVIKEGLPVMLEHYPDMKVIGSAVDVYDALKKLKYLTPDVIVLDISLPQLSGLDAITLFRRGLRSSGPLFGGIGLRGQRFADY